MNRVIKFRAWKEETKHMFFSEGFTGAFFLFDGDDDIKLHPGVPVMQFTGLTDKNGKEIYEGDVIQRYNESGGKNAVSFKEGRFAPYPWTYGMWNENCIVIGNIYENPELLSV